MRADAVLAFLQHIESKRGNGATTRNCRLAAIRSFADHLLRHDVTRAEQYGRILSIPTKRAISRLVSFLYNTGARVGEALAVRLRDLQLVRPRQVRLHGKGGKDRICPLWAETAVALRDLPLDAATECPIFRNARGAPLTRDGAAYIIAKHVARAADARPTLRRRRITPHVLRHSCAVALLQAGVDVTVIRDYLGHVSVATTSRYITTNLQMKREVLQSFWARAGLDRHSASRWRPTSKLLAFLSSL